MQGATNTGSISVYEKFAGYELYKAKTSKTAISDTSLTSATYWKNNGDYISEGASVGDWGTKHIYIASTLKKYKIDFYSNNKNVKTVSDVKYTTPLNKVTGVTTYVPEAPKSYLQFAGWYLDPVFENKADENTTMPNSDLILYAKWEAKGVNVTVHYNNDAEDKVDTVKGGTAYGELGEPEAKLDHTFAGWYIDEDCTKPYSGTMPIEQDTDIYAKWNKNDVVTVNVKYIGVDDDGTETVLTPEGEQTPIMARPGAFITVPAVSFDGYRPQSEFVNYEVKDSDNVVTIKYDKICDRFYQVVYRDADTNEIVASEDAVNARLRPTVTAKANMSLIPANYELVGDRIQTVDSKTLSKDGNIPTEIVFIVRQKTTDLTLAVDSLEKVYDGNTYSLPAATSATPGATIMYSVDDGKTWTEDAPTATNVVDSKTVKVKAVANGYKDSEILTATLTITPKPVTAKAGSASKPYDGNPLTAPAGTMEGLVGDDVATVVSAGSITLPGTADSKVSDIKWNQGDSRNYTVTEEPGRLEVTVRPEGQKYEIEVKAVSSTTTYNGHTQTISGLETTTFTVNGHRYKVEGLTANGQGKDAGEYKNKVTGNAVVKDEAGNDVTANFKVNAVNGELTIGRAPLTVTAITTSKPYDGKPLTAGATITGLVGGETLTADTEGSQTAPGTSSNKVDKINWTETTKESNYEVSITNGTLTVTNPEVAANIIVKAKSAQTTYNGQEQTVEGIENLNFTWNEEAYSIAGLTAKATGTNVKADGYVSTIEGNAIIKDSNGNDVTDCFNLIRENGLLQILPATVTAKAASKTWEYDGTTHTAGGTITGLVNGETAEVITEGSVQLPGDKATNKVTNISWGSTNKDNYTVTYEDGELEVVDRKEKYEITVEANSDTKVYNGKLQKVEGLKETTFVVEGNTYTVSGVEAVAQGTNVGEYKSHFSGEAVVKDSQGNDVTSQFTVNKNPGTLKITKAQPNIDVTMDGTTIGADGYIRKYNGTTSSLKATAVNSDKESIDGQFTYTVKNEDTGVIETLTTAPEFKDSGSWTVTVTTGNENCETKSVTVKVQILKLQIIIASEDQEWTYDGKEHKHEHANVHEESADQFVEGEEPEYHSFASITDAGETQNTFSYKFNTGSTTKKFLSRVARALGFATEGEEEIGKNYDVEVRYGTLKVNKAASDLHNLNIADKTVTYNGKEQSLDAATSDIESATIQYSADGGKTWTDTMPAFVDAGHYEVTARAVHGNYEDAEKTAVLTVLPAQLIVETESASKEYDGKPLTAGGKLVGVVDGDVIAIKMTGTQTEVGKSKNTYELDFGSTKASNYKITEKLGILEVTKAAEKPASKPSSKPKQDVPTALGLDPNLWTSIMGVSGAAMIMTVKLSRKEKNKKNKK